MANSERPNRTVNDFLSISDLEKALQSMGIHRSGSDRQHISFRHPVLESQRTREYLSNRASEEDDGLASSPSSVRQNLDTAMDWVLEKYDEGISEPQTVEEELRRLLALKSYMILDSEKQDAFERITGLASRLFRCPMALISLVDLGRQWFMSNRGLGEIRETKRKYAFCAHAIMSREDFLIVPDATKDYRFHDNPLVTGPPNIRFYAGAPLVSPEGYKLGTLCVLDNKPRPEGLTLEEKQNLLELSALAVQSIVDHRRAKEKSSQDPGQMLAYTAHDLLTPLTGVQLTLSELMEDAAFLSKLSSQHKEMIMTASNCTEVMGRICATTIESFRKGKRVEHKKSGAAQDSIRVSDLVKSLYMVMNPYPKKVPLIITVDRSVPSWIKTAELKVFRAAVNYLSNACDHTETGSVQLVIGKVTDNGEDKLLFECIDTGNGVPIEKYAKLFKPIDDASGENGYACGIPTSSRGFESVSMMKIEESGLGLFSVAVNITSIGGEYGFRPQGVAGADRSNDTASTGAIFWFKIPLVVSNPTDADESTGKGDSMFGSVGSMSRISSTEFEENKEGVFVVTGTNISKDVASHVHETFTRVLEGEQPATKGKKEEVGDKSVADSSLRSADEVLEVKEIEKRKPKALIIEDSTVVRKTMTRVLTRLGYETFQAEDGLEGFKVLQGTMFDVVFCDFLMPVMDGLDCVQQYRRWESIHRPFFRQRIIGISAHAGEKDVEKGMEVGMDDFRQKPLTYKQLSELQASEELKNVSDRLDEIVAAGTMTSDALQDEGAHSSSHEASSKSEDDEKTGIPLVAITEDNLEHSCLIAASDSSADRSKIERTATDEGWKTVFVENGEEALQFLKTRNWDVVLLDEDLAILQAAQCVSRFREWEEQNRVNRQRNVFLMSVSCSRMNGDIKSMVQLPHGFNGSMGKPVRPRELKNLMSKALRTAYEFGVRDPVLR